MVHVVIRLLRGVRISHKHTYIEKRMLHGEKTLFIPTSSEKQLLVPEMVKKKIRACIKTRKPPQNQ